MRFSLIWSIAFLLLLTGCRGLPGRADATERTTVQVIEIADVRALLHEGSVRAAAKHQQPIRGTPAPDGSTVADEPAASADCRPVGNDDQPVPATITTTVTERHSSAVTPSDPISPASVNTGQGGPAASSGAGQAVDHAAVERSRIITWSGVACWVIAAGLLIARAWVPLIPINATLVFAALGAALFWLPNIFSDNPWLIGVGLASVAVMYGIGFWDNRKLLNTPVPSPASPPT